MKTECLMVLPGKISCKDKIQWTILNSFPFTIAVDGGFDTLHSLGFRPDLSIGDFDSTEYDLEEISYNSNNTVALNSHKDLTDFEAALQYISSMKTPYVDVYGGIEGDRPDMLLSNLQVASAYAEKGMKIRFLSQDGTCQILLLSAGNELYMKNEKKQDSVFISVLSLSDESEILIEGLKYEYKGKMTNRESLGVSNETVEDQVGHIKCVSGRLLISCTSGLLLS